MRKGRNKKATGGKKRETEPGRVRAGERKGKEERSVKMS